MDKSKNVATLPDDAELAQRRPAAVAECRDSARWRRLRLLRGEDLELISRSLGVTAATLTA